jgi:DNA recombination protein RmuC
LLNVYAGQDVASGYRRIPHEDFNMNIWWLFGGLAAGITLTVLWERGSRARRVAALETALDGEARRRRELETACQTLDAERSRLLQELAVARSELETKEGELATQQEFLDATKREIENTFKALASNALEGNTRQFLELAEERLARTRSEAEGELEKRKQAIQSMIDPLKEAITKFEARTGDIEKARVNAYAQIDAQVRALAEQTVRLQEKTTSLDTALRGNQVRGRWGELALRNIVELAGMTEHCDFFEQQTVEGGGRPDMLVRLPGGRFIAVDAKAPLQAYLESMEATSEKDRAAALTRHVSDLRGHIRQLAGREYAAGLEGSLDLVVLFLPGDPYLSAAYGRDPNLQTDALAARILLTTPTTLVALLRTVAIYWRERSLAENAEEIAKGARDLYERVARFGQHLEKMGRGLSSAVDAYNRAVASFEHRLVPLGNRLKELRVSGRGKRQLAAPRAVDTALRLPFEDTTETLAEPAQKS